MCVCVCVCVCVCYVVLYTQESGRQLTQQVVTVLVYYLAVMCVSKYRNILAATEREDKPVEEGSTTSLTSNSEDVRTRTDSAAAELEPQSNLDLNESPELLPNQALSFTHGVEQSLIPSTSITLRAHALDISEQIEAAMRLTGPLLCELLTEHKAAFSKLLVGADGKTLLTDSKFGVTCITHVHIFDTFCSMQLLYVCWKTNLWLR